MSIKNLETYSEHNTGNFNNLSLDNNTVEYGQFTPTIVATTNVNGSVTGHRCYYFKLGAFYHVSFEGIVEESAMGITTVTIGFPFAVSFADANSIISQGCKEESADLCYPTFNEAIPSTSNIIMKWNALATYSGELKSVTDFIFPDP